MHHRLVACARAAFIAGIALSADAAGWSRSFGDFLEPPVAPPAPPPGPGPGPTRPPTTSTGPTPSPVDEKADPETRRLQENLQRLAGVTFETIVPLGSLGEIRGLTREYRASVDRALRQPFLEGGKPPRDLAPRVRQYQARWGDLADAIREGRKPATLSSATLARVRPVAGQPAPVGEVRVTGQLWSELSDAYFNELTAAEALAENHADLARGKPLLRELAQAMERTETALDEVGANREVRDSALQRRKLSFLLYQVWRCGARLQLARLARERVATDEDRAFDRFLKQMDEARNLRSRAPTGPAVGAADGTGPQPVPVAPGETLRARVGTTRAGVEVKEKAPDRLAELAAELYRAHTMIRRVERSVDEDDAIERDSMGTDSAPPLERRKRELEFLRERPARVAEQLKLEQDRRALILAKIVAEVDGN